MERKVERERRKEEGRGKGGRERGKVEGIGKRRKGEGKEIYFSTVIRKREQNLLGAKL